MARVLTLALVACAALIVASHVRGVRAEDDCAFDTWRVESLRPIGYDGLVCIWEPQP